MSYQDKIEEEEAAKERIRRERLLRDQLREQIATKPDDQEGELPEIGDMSKSELSELSKRVLTDLMLNAKSETVRKQAASELLDRIEGKPLQRTQMTGNMSWQVVSAIPAPPNSIKQIEGEVIEDGGEG